VPINRLEEQTGERCLYRERDHVIVAANSSGKSGNRSSRGANAATGHAWRLGDLIRVVAERIDPIRRRVEFALAETHGKKP